MGFLARSFQRVRVAHRIPAKVYELIAIINRRYSCLDFSSGEFRDLSEPEKLNLLIERINRDHKIARLNALSMIGSIIVLEQIKDTPSAGLGCNLCVRDNGLFIYDWNDYSGKHVDIPASHDALKKLGFTLDCETLRRAIVAYTNRKNYVKHATEFEKF